MLGAELLSPRNLRVRRYAAIGTVVSVVASISTLVLVHYIEGPGTASSLSFGVYTLAVAVALAGVTATIRRHHAQWQIRLFGFSASVLLWLPGAVVALHWLDSLGPPQSSEGSDADPAPGLNLEWKRDETGAAARNGEGSHKPKGSVQGRGR